VTTSCFASFQPAVEQVRPPIAGRSATNAIQEVLLLDQMKKKINSFVIHSAIPSIFIFYNEYELLV
jgi:hypothetical protein